MYDHAKEEDLNEDISEVDIIKEEMNSSTVVSEKRLKNETSTSGNDVKLFICSQCSTGFTTKYSLTRHEIQMHAKEVKFVCEMCDKKFMFQSELKQHLNKHSDGKNGKCDECGKTFKSKRSFSVHRETVHATDRPYQCGVCSRTFTSVKYLKSHSRVHNDVEGLHKCGQCPSAFQAQYYLIKHEIQIHGKRKVCETNAEHSCEQDFKCLDCGKIYESETLLVNHIKCSHATGRPFQCDECPKSFTSAGNLKSHAIVHSDNKPYQCDECPNTYKRQSELTTHKIETHRTGGNFCCELCGKIFQYLDNFQAHMSKHNGERNIKCDKCDKAFIDKPGLKIHKKYVHATEKPFKCKVCPKSFAWATFLRKHYLSHGKQRDLFCGSCPRKFRNQFNFDRHVKEAHSEDAKGEKEVEECPERFALVGSLRTYSTGQGKQKPFMCGLCPMKFQYKISMDKHIKEAHKEEETFEEDVKVEPVMIYDSEVKQEVTDIKDEIEEEMYVEVKQEPEEFI